MAFLQKETEALRKTALSFIKWILIALLTGTAGGLTGSLFHLSVGYVTSLRSTYRWFLYLLPAAGILIVLIYRLFRTENKSTNTIIESIQSGERVPIALMPAIFLSTVLTHLCGGSAGREGAALQIGGSIGNFAGRLCKLDDTDVRIATLSGMSAVFSALFGTPLTATVFALEVISVGTIHYSAFVPCLTASLTALGISEMFGIAGEHFAVAAVDLQWSMLLRTAGLSVLCALLSIVFCIVMRGSEHMFKKYIPNDFIRVFAGGAAIVGLTLLLGTGEFNGAGMDSIKTAIENGLTRPDAFLWKLLFTAITLGTGFKGGEVVPCFFVGATFGCLAGPLLGIPAGFAAAIGLVCLFCGAINCPIASILLSVELFGTGSIVYYALSCGIAYMLSGYFGLYSSQKFIYSKLKAEFININAK